MVLEDNEKEIFSYDKGKIIKDIKFLEEDYLPENVFYRNNQIREIGKSIGHFLEYKSPFYIFLYGPPGTGKTTTVKYIFKKLKEETTKIIPIYINSWKHPTGHSIMLEMAYNIDKNLYELLQFKRNPAESYGYIKRYLLKVKKEIILALDEIDKLVDKDLLYLFTRDKIPLIMISNDEFALKDLDDRIRSSLIYESIEFKKYSFENMMEILKDRHKHAFYPGTFPNAFIRVCASNAKGDARIGIGMMKLAAQIAEKKEKDKVELEDIKESYKESQKLKAMQILSTLKREHNILYNILLEKKEMKSSELYAQYNSISQEKNAKKITERTFRNYMQDLINKGLVIAKGNTRWRTYKINI